LSELIVYSRVYCCLSEAESYLPEAESHLPETKPCLSEAESCLSESESDSAHDLASVVLDFCRLYLTIVVGVVVEGIEIAFGA
jgi:hypothetical protein